MKINSSYKNYLSINLNTALGKPAIINGSPVRYCYPKVGIYNGPGASHSWLWFVEILDAMGFWDIEFIDDTDIKSGALKGLQVLLVSGGDTFAIAESLAQEGADVMKDFLYQGGCYIGSCAGAYLPLRSSLAPLNLFNYASVKISNLTKSLPQPLTMPEKFCTPYGCNYVFHPVREEVEITIDHTSCFTRLNTLRAPLYGGPSFLPSDEAETIARYSAFTDHTLFLLDRHLAHDTLIGKSAIVHKLMGRGHLFLLGPHLEHPHYYDANTLIADMMYHALAQKESSSSSSTLRDRKPALGKNIPKLLRAIKSEVSNSRIVALALERSMVSWKIGHKIYEPAKILAFLESVWSRFPQLEDSHGYLSEPVLVNLQKSFHQVTTLLRDIRSEELEGVDTTEKATNLFAIIKNSCADLLRIYFNNKLHALINDKSNCN